MTDHPVDAGLRSLGIDPDNVDPVVLAGIRSAADKPAKQLARDDLKTMSAEQIAEAERAGKLDRILGRKDTA